MKLTPNRLRHLLNLYPPYIGAGIKIDYISEDWRELHVSMKLRWYNRNIVGTHFGGSLYSMIDPHIMLLLMRLLGKEYIIWDKAAEIEFIKASKEKVFAIFNISDDDLENIRLNTMRGDKYFPAFNVEIQNESKDLVARARKVLYVKRKRA